MKYFPKAVRMSMGSGEEEGKRKEREQGREKTQVTAKIQVQMEKKRTTPKLKSENSRLENYDHQTIHWPPP